MDRGHIFQHWHLETFMGILRQRYPGSCPIMVEKSLEQIVIQLDQFVITIMGQGTVEVTASTNSHQLVEQLSIEVEQLLNQTNAHTQSQESQ
jgi:ArsR family metal-binding transcriptional regulator